jgi:hypothetical protein
MIACFLLRRNKMRIDSMVEDGVEISGEYVGTDSPRAPADQ